MLVVVALREGQFVPQVASLHIQIVDLAVAVDVASVVRTGGDTARQVDA
jgi:hypothetical protein